MNTTKSFGKARLFLMILLILAMSVGSVPIQAQDDSGSSTQIFLPIVQRAGDDTNNQEGGEVSAAIVGGNVVQQQIPWMVALVYRDLNNAHSGQFCGGTLIAPEWVLTAAHCVDDKSGSDIDVVIGRNDLTSHNGERIEVESDGIELNSYDDGTNSNDIALLHLTQPSQAQTVSLHYAYLNVAIGMSGWVLGWGHVDTQQTKEPYLKEASIALVPVETCGNNNGVADDDICLGTLDGTSSTCNGDSGGPLLVLINNEWKQVGITSFRNGDCGTPGSYWYDERISKHEAWILSTTGLACVQTASASSVSAASVNDCDPPTSTSTPPPGSTLISTPLPQVTPTPTPPAGGTVQPGQAQLFLNSSFSGGIEWDGGTGLNNGPNAQSDSLKMPSTWSAFVWAADNRQGDSSCFKGETSNLGAWSNRIQSIEVFDYDVCGGGSNPDVVLCTDTGSNPTQGCRGFTVGLHDLTTLGLNDRFRSIKSMGSGKSVLLLREGGYRGTAECYNGPREQLPGQEYGDASQWDLAAQVTTLQVFSSQNCPASQLKTLVIYETDNNGGSAAGVGTGAGVYNLPDIPHAGSGWSFNDWAKSVRVPGGKSVYGYVHGSAGGERTSCLLGGNSYNFYGSFDKQISSFEIFNNTTCTPPVPVNPTSFTVTGSGQTYIDLAWSNVDNETQFWVDRWNGATTSWQRVATLSANVLSWRDSTASCATAYTYKLTAHNNTGNSPGKTVSGSTTVCPTATPTHTPVPVVPTATATPTATQTPDVNNPGVWYEYYEGAWSSLPDFNALTAIKSGSESNFNISPANRSDYFAFRFTGCIDAPSTGSYTFAVASDDGSKIYLDGAEVVNNDGLHGLGNQSGTVNLTAGKHTITVTFFDNSGGEGLYLGWIVPGGADVTIPDSVLSKNGCGVTQPGGVPAATATATSTPIVAPTATSTSVPVTTATLTHTPVPVVNNPGVWYEYYEGTWSSLPDFNALTAIKSGSESNFNISPANRSDYYAFRFTGCIDAPSTGSYTFAVASDDGSKIFLDGVEVVNNDGLHGLSTQSDTVNLTAGKHSITVTFFDNSGGEGLYLGWIIPGGADVTIPDSVLSKNGCGVTQP